MKIKELQIDVFGGLENKRIGFSDGLNLIEGENESGKSTLMLFIKFMLYGLPRKGNEERDRSISRQRHAAGGSMTLSHGGEEYRIERTFAEGTRGGSEKLSVYRLSDGEVVFKDREPGEVFLKVPKEVFESSAFVGQGMCELTGGKKGAEAIRNLLTTADEHTDLSKIEEKLEKIRVGYRYRSGKGGKLPELSAQIQVEKQRLEKAVADGLRKTELEKKCALLAEQCADIEERLKKANSVLRQVAKLDLVHRFDALHEKEARLRDMQAELRRLRADEPLHDAFLTESEAARLCSLADQLETAERKQTEAEAEYEVTVTTGDFDSECAAVGEQVEREGGADAILWQMESLLKKKRILHLLGGILFLGGAVGAFLGFKTFESLIAASVAGGVAVLGLILFLWAGSFAARAKAIAADYGCRCATLGEYLYRCAEELEEKRAFAAVMKQSGDSRRLATARTEELLSLTEQALARFGEGAEASPTPETARKYAERIRRFLDTYRAAANRCEVLREGIAEEQRRLSSYDEQALRRELAEEGVGEASVDLARAEQEQRWVGTQKELLGRKRQAMESERIALAATAEDPMPIADRLSILEAQYAEADEYYEALEMALEALREAGDAMSGSVTPILGKRAGEIMDYLSAGRYADFFAGNDFVPALSHKDGYRVPSDLLSGGTKDAAYLALRIALMLQIYEGELPPLILDESLCQLDDTRMGRVLNLLSRLSGTDLQCLLFTCQSREADFCEEEGISCRVLAL